MTYLCRSCGEPTGRRATVCLDCRFWSKVDRREPGECWPWTGWRNHKRGGYGAFSIWPISSAIPAHRYAYERAHGAIPAGLVVRHSCDNPPCVNPAHLLVGTIADNWMDAILRGRLGAKYGRYECGHAVHPSYLRTSCPKCHPAPLRYVREQRRVRVDWGKA